MYCSSFKGKSIYPSSFVWIPTSYKHMLGVYIWGKIDVFD
jgi:hypothetical protein